MMPQQARADRGRAKTSGVGSTTVAELLSMAAEVLRHAGVAAHRRDARVLVGHVTGLGEATIVGYPERLVPGAAAQALEPLAARRAGGEPLSRVLGRREFWSLDFRLSEETLDPRPDSETLVEAVLERVADRAARLRILDLGTGSGCLLLALLSELPRAVGIGVDLSPGACSTAAANSRALGLAARASFAVSCWSSSLLGGFDIVVANPPYVPSGEVAGLSREVRDFDPRLALAGGDDGLDAYRTIAPDLRRLLRRGGFAAFEVGAGQGPYVATILAGSGMAVLSSYPDLAGIERCLVAEAPNP